MTLKDLVYGSIAVLLLVVGVNFPIGAENKTVVQQLGGASPVFDYLIEAHQDIVVGGGRLATSSAGAATYTASNIVNSHVIEHNATGALTVTLPTNANLTSAGFLPRAGDTKTLFIHASTTKITLAGSTGVGLFSASTTKDISPNTTGRVEFIRLGATEANRIEAILTAD